MCPKQPSFKTIYVAVIDSNISFNCFDVILDNKMFVVKMTECIFLF